MFDDQEVDPLYLAEREEQELRHSVLRMRQDLAVAEAEYQLALARLERLKALGRDRG